MRSESSSRTAIVTGGSRGIGRAICAALGARRFNVVVNYFGNAEAAGESVELVKQAGGEAVAVQADVGRDEDRRRLLDKTLSRFGGVDVLVNNAGIPPAVRADILETTEDVWDRVMDTNLKGPFFLSQIVGRWMVEGGRDEETERRRDEVPSPSSLTPQASSLRNASDLTPQAFCIINIGSLSGYAATVNRSQYCIAKAGMRMMTQLFAARLAAEGIGVFEICPGVIDTDMARGAKEKYDKLIHEGDLLPIARWGRPEDVAKAVLAIVDGYFPYSTGSVIDVDGGYHIRRL